MQLWSAILLKTKNLFYIHCGSKFNSNWKHGCSICYIVFHISLKFIFIKLAEILILLLMQLTIGLFNVQSYWQLFEPFCLRGRRDQSHWRAQVSHIIRMNSNPWSRARWICPLNTNTMFITANTQVVERRVGIENRFSIQDLKMYFFYLLRAALKRFSYSNFSKVQYNGISRYM